MSAYESSSPNGSGGLAGTVLSDRYRLEEQVGSGGMGTVWKATDTLLNRPVAVKLLHPAQMAEPTARERFRTEGRITAGLSHPSIAQVFDYGEEDGRAFLIMELVVGDPLSQVLRERGRLDTDQTLDFVCQAAQALAAAHARGVVHRDIKPGNLLVTADGRLKLTDFGIARGDMSVTLTQTGMVMGTAQYISPEQASGRPATSSSDLYALGVVAYECLAGTPPFTGDSPVALALAHTRDEPPELPEDIPDDVADLVFLLLSKDPEERPSSAGEVAHMAAVIRSEAGTGPLTPAAGFEGMAPTAIVGAVSGPGSGAVPRRTAGQPTVPSQQREDASTESETKERRVTTPVVLAAVGATLMIVAAVVAGFLYEGAPEADKVNSVETPSMTSSPSPTESEEPEESPVEEIPVIPDNGNDWSTAPHQHTESESPLPEDEEETSPPPDRDEDDEPGDETPDPPDTGSPDPPGGGDDGDPPPGDNGGGNGEGPPPATRP